MKTIRLILFALVLFSCSQLNAAHTTFMEGETSLLAAAGSVDTSYSTTETDEAQKEAILDAWKEGEPAEEERQMETGYVVLWSVVASLVVLMSIRSINRRRK